MSEESKNTAGKGNEYPFSIDMIHIDKKGSGQDTARTDKNSNRDNNNKAPEKKASGIDEQNSKLLARLADETKKWITKMKAQREKLILRDSSKTNFIDNIDAYVSDSEYFLSGGELVEAFEAIIWAWAYFEIGKDLGYFEGLSEE